MDKKSPQRLQWEAARYNLRKILENARDAAGRLEVIEKILDEPVGELTMRREWPHLEFHAQRTRIVLGRLKKHAQSSVEQIEEAEVSDKEE